LFQPEAAVAPVAAAPARPPAMSFLDQIRNRSKGTANSATAAETSDVVAPPAVSSVAEGNEENVKPKVNLMARLGLGGGGIGGGMGALGGGGASFLDQIKSRRKAAEE